MSILKGVQELAVALEVCGGVPNKRGELSERGSNIATRVSGNKLKKGKSHLSPAYCLMSAGEGPLTQGMSREKGTQLDKKGR